MVLLTSARGTHATCFESTTTFGAIDLIVTLCYDYNYLLVPTTRRAPFLCLYKVLVFKF